MPVLYYFMAWAVVLLFHVVVAPRIAVLGIFPDVLTAVIVLIGLKRGWREGLWFGFAFSLSVDLMNPQKLGWMTLLLSWIGFLSGVVRETILVENPWFEVVVVLLATFIYQALYRFLPAPQFFADNLLKMLLDSLLIAIYTVAAAALGLWILRQNYRLREIL
jgi:cell shape-determining protein MreD